MTGWGAVAVPVLYGGGTRIRTPCADGLMAVLALPEMVGIYEKWEKRDRGGCPFIRGTDSSLFGGGRGMIDGLCDDFLGLPG